jgi:hypothetical protein
MTQTTDMRTLKAHEIAAVTGGAVIGTITAR